MSAFNVAAMRFTIAEVLIQVATLFLLVIIGNTIFSIGAIYLCYSLWGFGFDAMTDFWSLLNNPNGMAAFKLLQVANQLGTFVFPAIIFPLIIRKKPLRFLQINVLPGFSQVIYVVVLTITVLPFISYTMDINSMLVLPEFLKDVQNWISQQEETLGKMSESMLQVNSTLALLSNLVVLALIPAVSEELFFRGIIQRLIGIWSKSPHWSIWITAILFSAIHLQFFGFLPRLLLGAILGYIFWASGNLYLSMAFHFVHNGVTVLASYFFAKHLSNYNPDASFPAYLIIASLLVSSVIMYLFFRSQMLRKTDKIAEEATRWVKVYSGHNLLKAMALLDQLQNAGANPVLSNKSDSTYGIFNAVEVFVPENEFAFTQSIIRQNEEKDAYESH